jgi:hypothetical protein
MEGVELVVMAPMFAAAGLFLHPWNQGFRSAGACLQ